MAGAGATEALLHGTCVALGRKAALLRGPSGAGKSDLALRFVAAFPGGTGQGPAAALVSDDQVRIVLSGDRLLARPPATIAGRIEVRGVGIVAIAHLPEAALALVVELTPHAAVPRMPPDPLPVTTVLGVGVPVLNLSAFEASAPVKLKMALERAP